MEYMKNSIDRNDIEGYILICFIQELQGLMSFSKFYCLRKCKHKTLKIEHDLIKISICN